MKLPNALLVACSLLLPAGPVRAHHAFAAEFDPNQPVTLKGSITKVEWLNPHTRAYLDVKAPAGAVTKWELQLASPNGLVHQGWTRDSLKAGDVLTVSGYLARGGSHLASVRTIRFADGRLVTISSPGDGGPAK